MRTSLLVVLSLFALWQPARAEDCSIKKLWDGSPFSSPAFLIGGYWIRSCENDPNLQIVEREIGLTDVQNKVLFTIPKNSVQEAFLNGTSTVLDLYDYKTYDDHKTYAPSRRAFFLEKSSTRSYCAGKYELVSLSLQGRSSDEWQIADVHTGLCFDSESDHSSGKTLEPVTVMDFIDDGQENLDLAIVTYVKPGVQGIHFEGSTGKASLLFDLSKEKNGEGVPRLLPETKKLALFTQNPNDQVFLIDYSDPENLKFEEKYRDRTSNPWTRDYGPSFRDLRPADLTWVELYPKTRTLYYVTRKRLPNGTSEPFVVQFSY